MHVNIHFHSVQKYGKNIQELSFHFGHTKQMFIKLDNVKHSVISQLSKNMSSEQCEALKFSWIENNRNKVFTEFIQRSGGSFNDVILVSSEMEEFPANKLVLSACSPFFENIFKSRIKESFVMCLANISSRDLANILEFVYKGTLNVPVGEVEQFISTGNTLNIKGIVSEPEKCQEVRPRKRGRKKKILSESDPNTEKDSSNEKSRIENGENNEPKEETEDIVSDKIGSDISQTTVDLENVKEGEDREKELGDDPGEDPISVDSENTSEENELITCPEEEASKASDMVEEIKQYSKDEIMKAYKQMLVIKGMKRGRVETDTEEPKPRQRSSKEKVCDKCDYATKDSSNFKRHLSRCPIKK